MVLSGFLGTVWGYPIAKVTLHVVDENGNALSGIPFQMGAVNPTEAESTYGPIIGKTVNGSIGKESPSAFGVLDYSAVDVPGYYNAGGKYRFTNAVSGKWQPWNPTVEVVVKPILNPIPMYAININLDIPVKDKPVGFDLEASDWVAPYGKGTVSDFIFSVSEKIPFVNYSQPYDVTWALSFSNKGDGIQSVLVPQNVGSALRLPRVAPKASYQATLVQELSLNGNKRLNGADGENQNYFYRVRTVLDEQGNVKSALYGKIAGTLQCWGDSKIHMIYYLNPTPNDRNMEFDPKKNLFKNLSDLQQVNAP